jgi:hypothetical protein
MTDELAATVAALKAEPLWAASSAARELFHSDMLKWLAEERPEAFAAVLGLDSVPPYRCERERGHLDLRVIPEGGGRPVVVENKLFSLPNEGQLDTYRTTTLHQPEMEGTHFILLSLADPGWLGDRYGDWTWMSYRVLGQLLIETSSKRSHFPDQFVRHWGKLCLHLHALAELVSIKNEEEPYDLGTSLSTHLDARLKAFADLLRTDQLRRRIKDHLADEAAVKVGFTRTYASIEDFPGSCDGDELGWQLHRCRPARRDRCAAPASEGREGPARPGVRTGRGRLRSSARHTDGGRPGPTTDRLHLGPGWGRRRGCGAGDPRLGWSDGGRRRR